MRLFQSALYLQGELSPGVITCNRAAVRFADRVGGRTLSTQVRVKDGGTETFDLGGQWVGSAQTDIMETLDELGLDVYPQYIQVS